ncbi:MAG TPA: pantoate--beta-alanine ligase [Anaerolineales bacterium]
MKLVHSLPELRLARGGLPGPLGLVPTMGYLHEGHLSMVRRARAECASVAVSIFVNPAQFGPDEDLASYPVDLERDQALLEQEAVDLLWIPTADQMYPAGFQTWVTVDELTRPLEGEHRPGHFRGVATVVAKLFNALQPDRAYFGQKDAQQLAVVRRMAQDLDFRPEVVACLTVREADGLAMSSRNARLNPKERRAAAVLYRALSAAQQAYAGGERQSEALRRSMVEMLRAEPLARIQYISVADPETLAELPGEVGRALLSMAVFLGKTRLIDNVLLGD